MEQNQKSDKSNSVIDALKRLERAGSENSRTTQKLREAMFCVASKIEENVPDGITLPRGYRVDEGVLLAPYGDRDNIVLNYDVDNGDFIYNVGHVYCPGRYEIHRFAADIADGLLDEIAAFLEERAAQNEKATVTLEAAAVKL